VTLNATTSDKADNAKINIDGVARGRESVRLNTDGSIWIVPDITPVEAQRVLHDVALTGAGLLRDNRALTAERDRYKGEVKEIVTRQMVKLKYERDRLRAEELRLRMQVTTLEFMNQEMLDELYRLRNVVGDGDENIINKVIDKVEKSSS